MSTESSTTSSSKPERTPWRVRCAAFLGALLIAVWKRTLRFRFHGEEEVRAWEREGKRYIMAFWHRHLLFMRYAYRGDRLSCLISQSKDGELIARIMEYFAVFSARGSSSRAGASGMKTMIRLARQGYDLSITPDGPRGPLREVQPGVILAAAASGLPIVPIAFSASHGRALDSWDRFLVPWPGSRVHVIYGEPFVVARRANTHDAAEELKIRMIEVERRAEILAGHSGELPITPERYREQVEIDNA